MSAKSGAFTCVGLLLLVLGSSAGAYGQFGHIFVLMEENMEYSSVVGNTVAAPYFNSLLQQYGLATNYYAVTKPSIGNYFMLTTGQVFTNNDNFSGTFSGDNIIRHFVGAGITWKSYAEGYATRVNYDDKHNVFVFFSDIQNSAALAGRIVETDSLSTDIANHTLPQFGFIVPNELHNGHSGPLADADSWAQTHVGPLIASADFQRDGLLLIVWDEGSNLPNGTTDTTYGGGHTVLIMVGPRVRPHYVAATLYQHPSALRLMMKGLGLAGFPGAAASAPDMDEFFLPAAVATDNQLPGSTYQLSQNYPNPFNPSTQILYRTGHDGFVSLNLYDVAGREVESLVNEEQHAGAHSVTLNARKLASGVYFYRLLAGDFAQTRKLILAK